MKTSAVDIAISELRPELERMFAKAPEFGLVGVKIFFVNGEINRIERESASSLKPAQFPIGG